MNHDIILEVKNLKKYFPIKKTGCFNKEVTYTKAVDNVSFDVRRGECLGVIGESGSGKTTVVRTLLRAYSPTSGEFFFHSNDAQFNAYNIEKKYDKKTGQFDLNTNVTQFNIANMSKKDLKQIRPHMQMIFQDPYSSLNPRMTVERIVGEPLKVSNNYSKKEIKERVADMLKKSGLKPEHASRYPHAFSGGQRQRIGIARALILKPELVVADEAVSALDVSVQAQILNLLHDLKNDLNLTYIFIAHDFSVIKHSTDRVVVMYCGSVMEVGPTDEICKNPCHPYTKALMSSIPEPNPRERMNRIPLQGEVPDPSNAPAGCKFHTRCPHMKKGLCDIGEQPDPVEIGDGHTSACLRINEPDFEF